MRLQDRSIAVWDMSSTTEIMLRRVLVGHRAAVNVVDFDEKYIVSASGDRTIKVKSGVVKSCYNFINTTKQHVRNQTKKLHHKCHIFILIIFTFVCHRSNWLTMFLHLYTVLMFPTEIGLNLQQLNFDNPLMQRLQRWAIAMVVVSSMSTHSNHLYCPNRCLPWSRHLY